MILAAAVLMGATPLQAFATETKIGYLPEVELGEDVLENDVFYLGSTTGILEENAHAVYLLKVGRGGEAESESTALVKIADMTARYGQDYVVRVHDTGAEVPSPEDNSSLLDLMLGSDYEQAELGSDEDLEGLLQDDEARIDTVYEEDIYVGYRYFDTFGVRPAYPFGFGLSYTDFLLEPEEICFDGEALTLRLFVKNMGKVPGKEVAQVYIGKPDTDLEKPRKELVWFEKSRELAPGELAVFSVTVPKAHLTAYSEERAATLLEAGEYTVFVGNSSAARPCGSFTVEETETVKQVHNLMQPDRPFTRLSKHDPAGTWPKGAHSGVKEEHFARWPLPYAQRGTYEAVFEGKAPAEKLTFADVQAEPSRAEDFVAQLSVEELARLSVCNSSGWGMEGTGEAGFVSQLDGS